MILSLKNNNESLKKEAIKNKSVFTSENDIQDDEALERFFGKYNNDCVVNLATQAGVSVNSKSRLIHRWW